MNTRHSSESAVSSPLDRQGIPFPGHFRREIFFPPHPEGGRIICWYICSLRHLLNIFPAPLCTQAWVGLWAPGPWAPHPIQACFPALVEGTVCKRILLGTKKARLVQRRGGRRSAALLGREGTESRVAEPRLGRTAGEALNSQPRGAPGRSSSQHGRLSG